METELLPHDAELLAASAISKEVIAERGYYTAVRKSQLEGLGFKRGQCVVPALVIPIRDSKGQLVTYQTRPHWPRIDDRTGRPVKYETPATVPPALDVPARVAEQLRSPAAPLWITEGARKADSAVSAGMVCISVPGVWSWVKRLNGDARTVLPDLVRVGFHERKVILAFDSDVMGKSAVQKALAAFAEYLTSRGAFVQFCYLPELEPGEKTGLDDFLAAGNAPGDLWEYVSSELRAVKEKKQDRPAWPTANLLWEVEQWLRRYVVFPDEHHLTVLALWVLHTWAFDEFSCTPYLNVCSATKRAGKSRTLEVLEVLCRNPLKASSITEAALYQAIEARRPTFLIDEVDTLFTSRSERSEAVRGVLNDGYRESGKVLRGSQEGELQEYSVYCPKALGGINTGRMPDTVADRCITITLKRKRKAERVARMRRRDIDSEAGQLTERFADWAAEHADTLGKWQPAEPITEISDRAEEVWEPLLAIADLAGDDWPVKTRHAAIALSGADSDEEDHSEVLLAALRDVFADEDAIPNKDICKTLNERDDLPFHDYRKGSGIDVRRLNAMLRAYDIRPKTVRKGEETPKGFKREQFEDAWERYLVDPAEADTSDTTGHTETPVNTGDSDDCVSVSGVSSQAASARRGVSEQPEQPQNITRTPRLPDGTHQTHGHNNGKSPANPTLSDVSDCVRVSD